jgi:transposase
MLVRVLVHHHRELKRLAQSLVAVPAQPNPIQAQVATPQECEPTANTNSRRYARFMEVHDLRAQGFTISAIARQTGMDRKTVRKYLNLTTLPAYRLQRRRFSKLRPYQAYLLEHWQNGRRTVRQLWLDIRELGFKGSHSVVATFMAQVRKERGLPSYVRTDLQCPVAPPVLSPRRAAWLLLARPDQLTEEDLRVRSALPDLHSDIHSAASTAQWFAQLVRDRLPDAFDEWLQHSLQSTLPEIRSFARGIQRDYAAVKAALTLPWSNGMVEGHVNRLKFVKRQMFGRAKFDLLRLRVLA